LGGRTLESNMLYVSAVDLSPLDLALLGNNIRPSARQSRRQRDDRANRRVLAAVNRSLASFQERIDRLHQMTSKATDARRAIAS
jgi:hypothetical protein